MAYSSNSTRRRPKSWQEFKNAHRRGEIHIEYYNEQEEKYARKNRLKETVGINRYVRGIIVLTIIGIFTYIFSEIPNWLVVIGTIAIAIIWVRSLTPNWSDFKRCFEARLVEDETFFWGAEEFMDIYWKDHLKDKNAP